MAADRTFALIQVLALNRVPLYGVYALGWSWGTVLVLPQLGIKQNNKPFKESNLAERGNYPSRRSSGSGWAFRSA